MRLVQNKMSEVHMIHEYYTHNIKNRWGDYSKGTPGFRIIPYISMHPFLEVSQNFWINLKEILTILYTRYTEIYTLQGVINYGYR